MEFENALTCGVLADPVAYSQSVEILLKFSVATNQKFFWQL